MLYTLITGASSELGRAFAVECARRGQNLLLADLPGSYARTLCAPLRQQFGVDAQVVELDLTEMESVKETIDTLTEKYEINFLINNAGLGGTASIVDSPASLLDKIIQLNVRSSTLLTHMLLPHLLQQKQSFILNVSSMAAFTPIAYKTVYPASKAFISSFSHGLRQELDNSPVSVSVLYPGPLMTNFDTSLRIMRMGHWGQWGLMSTKDVASLAIRKTLRKKAVIIPGFFNRFCRALMRLIPLNLRLHLVSREVKKEIFFSNL
ncbi:MAG TPA: SDR family NAD(P)-dependent oxidoreductase [Flavihumibacter sp.]|jgi:short-subunit dehydrogenase